VARALQLRYLAAPTHNAELAALFRELLRLETATYDTEEGRHNGTQGFARAAAVLRAAPAPITSLAALRRMELPFLGPDCVGFIAEFLREGELAGRIERLEGHRRDDKLCAKALFLKVPGVGLTFAGQWAEDGHRSLGDLQRAYAAETLRDQTKLGALGSAAVPCGDTLLSPIPLPEFTELHDAVQQAAREVDTTLQCELTGGYSRRFVTPDCMVLEPHAAQADSSYHDVDVLVKYDDRNVMYAGGADWALTQLVRRLRKRLEVLVADMSGVDGSGEDAMCVEWDHICGKTPVGSANIDQFRKAFMIVKLPGKPPRRVDVVFVPASQYAFAILGWTGSRQFERWIRIYVRLAWLPIPRRHRCSVYCAALMQALTQRHTRHRRPRSRSRRYG
jgi:DNA polymerase mu